MRVCFRNVMVSHYGHLSTAIKFDLIHSQFTLRTPRDIASPYTLRIKDKNAYYAERNAPVRYSYISYFWIIVVSIMCKQYFTVIVRLILTSLLTVE